MMGRPQCQAAGEGRCGVVGGTDDSLVSFQLPTSSYKLLDDVTIYLWVPFLDEWTTIGLRHFGESTSVGAKTEYSLSARIRVPW